MTIVFSQMAKEQFLSRFCCDPKEIWRDEVPAHAPRMLARKNHMQAIAPAASVK
jgi:hypothetical protein